MVALNSLSSFQVTQAIQFAVFRYLGWRIITLAHLLTRLSQWFAHLPLIYILVCGNGLGSLFGRYLYPIWMLRSVFFRRGRMITT